MDVTSLLNSNAAEQQKSPESPEKETSRSPPRNRTPWDAGGYSLPINTKVPTPPPNDSHNGGSVIETPVSASVHHHSDSRSSLSSFTSSLQSRTHSRFSSMSTVSSSHPMSGVAPDCLSPDSRAGPHALDFASLQLSKDTSAEPRSRTSLSPTDSLDALALVAEHRLHKPEITIDEVPACRPMEPVIREESAEKSSEQTPPRGRPSSPSDAMLIRRTTLPVLRLNTSEEELRPENYHRQQSQRLLSTPMENHHQSLLHAKSHKRALSAPDFPPPAMRSSPMGPRAEPTPPSSIHPDNSSPTTPLQHAAPDTPPTTTADTSSQDVVCMFTADCDTGSQLRKAISHIFGRNKMCTRLIPQHIWVHYCRKHYQRSRYRNAKEYAKTQCDLVVKQIQRVHEWSEQNKVKGEPGIVRDWGLAVRKREQQRLDNLASQNRKRRAGTLDESEAPAPVLDEDGYYTGSLGNIQPPTAVPDWLLAFCGKGYSTDEILNIFYELYNKIMTGEVPQFPDIEILPNIIVDQEETGAKSYSKSIPVAGGHKRSQSLGSVNFSPDRRLSQSSDWSFSGPMSAAPAQKRRRPNDRGEEFEYASPISRLPRQQLPHRPMFSDIDEHRAVEGSFSDIPRDPYHDFPRRYRGSSADSFPESTPSRDPYREWTQRVRATPPLPAPTPQRMTPESMASHLEPNEHFSNRGRPMHRRSQSDMSSFITRGPQPIPYSSPAPHSAYPSDRPPLMRQTHSGSYINPSPSELFAPSPNTGTPFHHFPEHAHSRHQSLNTLPRPSYYHSEQDKAPFSARR